ncbi:MAG TPA: hypothetical protein VI731_11225 [Bacteroidia bacterium]|nr:hypothetical protein [Bacteroidia bacterium]
MNKLFVLLTFLLPLFLQAQFGLSDSTRVKLFLNTGYIKNIGEPVTPPPYITFGFVVKEYRFFSGRETGGFGVGGGMLIKAYRFNQNTIYAGFNFGYYTQNGISDSVQVIETDYLNGTTTVTNLYDEPYSYTERMIAFPVVLNTVLSRFPGGILTSDVGFSVAIGKGSFKRGYFSDEYLPALFLHGGANYSFQKDSSQKSYFSTGMFIQYMPWPTTMKRNLMIIGLSIGVDIK